MVVLAGHTVRRFDVPQLERLLGARVVDTLELACLVFPGEPSQALDKLYREHTSLSDPVLNGVESAQILARCLRALPDLPGLVRGQPIACCPPASPMTSFRRLRLAFPKIGRRSAPCRCEATGARCGRSWTGCQSVTGRIRVQWCSCTGCCGDLASRRPAWITQEAGQARPLSSVEVYFVRPRPV
ncbi:hypothetical protein [Deinococcus aquaedulcis]|uniref:hypothetical protein n=1 Tax=Deinococcus aquaedulcis TaxID=2840455 RepID=UPI001C84059D|nr:hypothetical protein [Deinococcus aquaedulcis]